MRSDLEILESSAEIGYVGGGYYNPVDEFARLARPVSSDRLQKLLANTLMSLTPGNDQTHCVAAILQEVRSQVRSEECLFALYDTGKYRFAVLIPSEERLMDFESQVYSGRLKRQGFFALSRDQADIGLVRQFSQP